MVRNGAPRRAGPWRRAQQPGTRAGSGGPYRCRRARFPAGAGGNAGAFEPLANLAQNLYQQKRFAEALPYFDALVERFPAGPAALWANRSVCLSQTGRLAEADTGFRKALVQAPDTASLQRDLGLNCIRLQRYEDAAGALERAVALDSNDLLAQSMLLCAAMNSARWERFDDASHAIIDAAGAIASRPEQSLSAFDFAVICDDPELQWNAARSWTRGHAPRPHAGMPPARRGARPAAARFRVHRFIQPSGWSLDRRPARAARPQAVHRRRVCGGLAGRTTTSRGGSMPPPTTTAPRHPRIAERDRLGDSRRPDRRAVRSQRVHRHADDRGLRASPRADPRRASSATPARSAWRATTGSSPTITASRRPTVATTTNAPSTSTLAICRRTPAVPSMRRRCAAASTACPRRASCSARSPPMYKILAGDVRALDVAARAPPRQRAVAARGCRPRSRIGCGTRLQAEGVDGSSDSSSRRPTRAAVSCAVPPRRPLSRHVSVRRAYDGERRAVRGPARDHASPAAALRRARRRASWWRPGIEDLVACDLDEYLEIADAHGRGPGAARGHRRRRCAGRARAFRRSTWTATRARSKRRCRRRGRRRRLRRRAAGWPAREPPREVDAAPRRAEIARAPRPARGRRTRAPCAATMRADSAVRHARIRGEPRRDAARSRRRRRATSSSTPCSRSIPALCRPRMKRPGSVTIGSPHASASRLVLPPDQCSVSSIASQTRLIRR